MTASRVAAALIGVAGLAWIVAGVTVDPAQLSGSTGLYVAGLVLMLLGLAAFGYSLVTTAPVWLRAVVALATPALGYVVWAAIWDGIGDGRDKVLLLAGLVLALVAVTGALVSERRARRTS